MVGDSLAATKGPGNETCVLDGSIGRVTAYGEFQTIDPATGALAPGINQIVTLLDGNGVNKHTLTFCGGILTAHTLV